MKVAVVSAARRPAPGRLARSALWHAERGLSVFPLAPQSKRPAVEDWPHIATTDPDQIARWWSTAPYNVGVATGPSGLLVVDLDRPKDAGEVVPEPWCSRGALCGRDVLELLAADTGEQLPRTWSVRTAGSGQHLYFRQPEGSELGNTAGRLGWRIDTRGHGGYVVGAGSITCAGRYRATDLQVPQPLPGWIIDALDTTVTAMTMPADPSALRNASAYTLAALSGEIENVLAATPGHRNDTLNRAAFALGQLVGAVLLDQHIARDELLSAAGRIGLPRPEAERTITSGLTAGARRPRQRTA
ncbi:bifunctional DNA primase/polymerase [Kribbella solani]|uniref:bifunctional DNA primase/polymerase n=1 Tax=Kribbella solani TaxID=236067 RepID=UPI0029BB38E2|nr:bifunctional DNA primase/polymerase [Kribbella solani]MDX3003252.1 bifunctional DNA primase/polymerase [Kribbella solani]